MTDEIIYVRRPNNSMSTIMPKWHKSSDGGEYTQCGLLISHIWLQSVQAPDKAMCYKCFRRGNHW